MESHVATAREPDRLTSLPTELSLLVLSFLDPPSLCRCQEVCKAWQSLAVKDGVWRSVALNLGYLPPGVIRAQDLCEPPADVRWCSNTNAYSLDYVKGVEPVHTQVRQGESVDYPSLLTTSSARGYYDGLVSFQDLCIRKWRVDARWSATREHETGALWELQPEMRLIDAAPPLVRPATDLEEEVVEEEGRDVWRIKLDPVDRTIISTGQRGGVRVLCLDTKQVLWRLPQLATRQYPHVEFDRGFMVFDRMGHGHFEVWRAQRLAGADGQRGHFDHYATLASPRPPRALRFQYPNLVVATLDGHLLTWDIVSKTVVQDIDLEDSVHKDNVNYIDFDDEFIFLCGTGGKCVTAVSRKKGSIIWSLSMHFESNLPPPSTYLYERRSDRCEHYHLGKESLQRTRRKSPWQEAPSRHNFAQLLMTRGRQEWSAVHPDHRTNTLVVVGDTDVLLIRDYKVVFRAWEKLAPGQAPTEALCIPSMFADLFFGDDFDDPQPSTYEGFGSQLAVADGRAFCIAGRTLLIDLDPGRQSRANPSTIPYPSKDKLQSSETTDQFAAGCDEEVSTHEAGFAVYDSSIQGGIETDEGLYTASVTLSTCAQMDSTAAYCVCISIDNEEWDHLPTESHVLAVVAFDFASSPKNDQVTSSQA